MAVALLDSDVYPQQFGPARIEKDDVQQLLRKIEVHTGFPLHKPMKLAGLLDPYTEAYPDKVKAKVQITRKDGKTFACEKGDYPGFLTDPLTWPDIIEKFKRLTGNVINESRKNEIIECVKNLEKEDMATLTWLICI